MPLNYLQLQPQIEQYSQRANLSRQELASKLQTALELLRNCGQRHPEIRSLLNEKITSHQRGDRCALLADEPADSSCESPKLGEDYILLTSDGSQIIPSAHDALSVALVNTSRLCYQPGSGHVPRVDVLTKFITDKNGEIELGEVSEDLVSLKRDVEEMRVLAEWQNDTDLTVIALGDGPLELFHQPRSEADFARAFDMYQASLSILHNNGAIAAGYTDRPRASLVAKMLEYLNEGDQQINLVGLEDLVMFSELLNPGQRSAVFGLWSTSSQKYTGDLALHFFYLNVGSKKFPWLARIEIPAWVADEPQRVSLLQRALLDQCSLMGTRPYPYLLHRAHEEAVVHFDEKEQLIARLATELQRHGLGLSAQSNKLSAKDLQSRTRME
ncbi:MAG: DNA double-strand break repair nuclease NurA [Anaerolineaceae bacterium]|nr:DNA double-strand break repair nuclease NurA [Anaerolineaceae bacterium]